MASPSSVHAPNEPLDHLTLLYSLADLVQRTRHVELVYREAVEGLRIVLGLDRAALLVLDGGLMRFRAWSGLSERLRSEVEGFAPWPAHARDPRSVLLSNVATAPEAEPVRSALVEAGVGSLGCVPLLHHNRLLGELLLFRESRGGFEDVDVRLTEAVAGQLALAIRRSRSDADQAELLRRFEAERSVLESVVKQMPSGVLLADAPSGRIVMSNAQVSEIWGNTLRTARQVSDYALWGGRDANGAPLPATSWPLARSVLTGETVRAEEIEIDRADGARAIVRMSSRPVLDSHGRQIAAVATVYDVTRERIEEQEHAFIERATQALNASLESDLTVRALLDFVVGPYADWCVVYLHDEPDLLRVQAAAHVEPDATEQVETWVPDTIAVDADHPISRAVRERTPRVVTDHALEALLDAPAPEGDGGVGHPASGVLLVLPLVVRGDRSLGALCVGRAGRSFGGGDVALLGELARRAAVALDNAILYGQARSADRAKSNFLAVMSHEFRTPLSAILGYADILTAEVHGELTETQRRHLDRVKASVRHLSHLVDEILSFASMEAGRERIRSERVELVTVVNDVVGIMEPIAEAAGLELRVELPPPPVELETDVQKLRQILINLLSNALKYTPKGRVELAVEREDGRVWCRVTDTGPGIAAGDQENVFEPFWQVDRGDGPRIRGTGLGLAVARRLARLMGGDVTLESHVGRGSTFALDLPTEPPTE